jgi:hypothetical protein
MRFLPKARKKDLIVQELPDEVLVYDLKTNKALCLNHTAALIWKNCDGDKDIDEIAGLLGQKLEAPVSKQVVKMGLQELTSHQLVREGSWQAPNRTGVSRRQSIKQLGLTAAIVLPLIISITAPTAAAAATDPCAAPTGRPETCPCTSDNDCASQNCNAGICGPHL